MPTKEQVALTYARRELKSDHHPFLDEMRQFFTPEKFTRVLTATKEQYGTYLSVGDVPVYDRDVLAKVDTVIAKAREAYELSDNDERDIRAAAHFAIWAHGTDTRFVGKRFRHETKADGSPQPYAMHLARVAERLTDFDPITIQVAFLHDVLENTRYTEENLKDIFGYEIAGTCKKISKISTDSIEDMLKDLDQVELGVARDYLNQFRLDEEVERIVKYLDDQLEQTAYYKNITVGNFETYHHVKKHFQNAKLISEVLKEHVLGEDEAQMLSLIRLLSVFEKEEDVRALVVKCADSADNMTTIQSLAEGRGREKAESKAKIASSVFAPLARVLGLDSLALEIENPTFIVLETSAAKIISGKLDRLERYDRITEREIQDKIKQFISDFVAWANARSSQLFFSDGAVKVALRYPEACEIHRHGIPIKSKMAPLIEIYIRDKFTAKTFYDFLTQVASDSNGRVVANNIMEVFGERVRRANFRFTALRHNRDLLAMIYDGSGDIVDLFRSTSPSWQKANASDKLGAILTHLRSGDFADFLADLQAGKTIKITLFTSGRRSNLKNFYIPEGATIADALILSGNGRRKPKVIRNGETVEAHDLQPGDILELDPITDRGDSLYHPVTMDRLKTAAARIRLRSELMDILNRDSSPFYETKEGIALGAKYRGLRILAALSDIKAANLVYRRFSAYPYKDVFFESLLGSHRTLVDRIVRDDFLINLGITPLVFPSDQSSVSHGIYKEWSELPKLESILNRLIRWVSDNCYEVRPINELWQKVGESANSRGESVVLGDYLRRLHDLTEGVLRDIIYIPVSDGQISSNYPFYIAIDPFNLRQYVKRMNISEEVALTRLFDNAHKVIAKFSD